MAIQGLWPCIYDVFFAKPIDHGWDATKYSSVQKWALMAKWGMKGLLSCFYF